MRRSLIAVTLVLGAVAALYGALILLDLLSRSEDRSTRSLQAGERVVLETGSGDIEVVASDGPPRVELRTVSGLWGAPEVRVRRGPGGAVSVDADCPGLSFVCSAEARLLVPAGTSVRADTGSGSVTVRGMSGGVDAETGSGDVELAGVGGARVAADTGSGSIAMTGRAGAFVAETGSGDVRADLSEAPESVSIDTGSGGVELRLPDVGYDLETDTGSGDEQVEVRREPGAPRRVRIDTGSGDVRVRPAR